MLRYEKRHLNILYVSCIMNLQETIYSAHHKIGVEEVGPGVRETTLIGLMFIRYEFDNVSLGLEIGECYVRLWW